MPGIEILNDFEDRKQIEELRIKQKQNDYYFIDLVCYLLFI